MLTKPEKGLTCGEEGWGRTGRLFYFVLFFLFFFVCLFVCFFIFFVREAKSERDQNCSMAKDSIFFQFDLCQCVCPNLRSVEKGEYPDVKSS